MRLYDEERRPSERAASSWAFALSPVLGDDRHSWRSGVWQLPDSYLVGVCKTSGGGVSTYPPLPNHSAATLTGLTIREGSKDNGYVMEINSKNLSGDLKAGRYVA